MKMRELINVNTKVRRLGYFAALLRLVQERSLGTDILLARFIGWGKENQHCLIDYTDSTGDIVPRSRTRSSHPSVYRTPYAAKRYVEFAKEVGWLTQISGACAITRIGRILLTLPGNLLEENANPFFLSLAQRLFFLHELWCRDGDILFTLLQQLGTHPLSLHQIQSNFGDAYYDHLSQRMQQLPIEYEQRELLERRNSIAAWQSPARYAEHIVPPRLHWLLDLGLLYIESSSQRKCYLTPIGQEFKKRFSTLEALTDKWLDSNFFKAVADCLATDGVSISVWRSNHKDQEALNSWLHIAFKTFQRGSIPKLPATQTILFLCICLIINEGIAADIQDILQFLSKPIKFDVDHVIEARLSGRENESYLTLNPI